MLRIFTALALLGLVACASKPTESLQHEPDYSEAARLNTRLGIDYLRKGETLLAIEKLEKALAQDGKLSETHLGLALAYTQIGEVQGAERSFKRALELADNDANVYNSYGVFLCGQGQTKEAEESFLAAAANKRYATPEVAFANAGACALQNGDAATAENYFRRALQRNPRYAEALYQLADLSYQTGDFLRARAFLQRFEAVRPATPDTLLLGLRTEYALGDAGAARVYSEKLRAAIPNIGQHINLTTGQPL